jgi:hypothetical protein
MKTTILSSLLFLAFSTVANAGTFCVGDFTQTSLEWNLRTLPDLKLVTEIPRQEAGLEWSCMELPEGTRFQVEVSNADMKYQEPSCEIPVQGGQWVKVIPAAAGAGRHIDCQHFSDAGQMKDSKEETAGTEEGWILRGFESVGGPVKGASINVWDAAGNLVVTRPNATSKGGIFAIPMKTPLIAGFRIEAKGGTLDGKPFKGTLVETIGEKFDIENDRAYLNPVTNLITEYQLKKAGIKQSEAEARVRAFLALGSSLDLGIGVMNPYLSFFNEKAYRNEAMKNGGFDPFVAQLLKEMDSSADAVHTMADAKMLQFSEEEMLKKLMDKAMGEAGSKIFAEFKKSMGFPDKDEEMFKLLNQIMAQLADIKRQLDALAIVVTQGNYNLYVAPLDVTWGHIQSKILSLQSAAKQAEDNVDPRTHLPKDAKLASDIKANVEEYENYILTNATNFIDDVHTYFVPEPTSGRVALQKSFAEAVFQRSPKVLRPSFFTAVNQQLATYRGHQVTVLALALDGYREKGNNAKVNDIKAVQAPYIEAVIRILPDNPVFSNAQVVSAVESGSSFYDIDRKRLWSTHYRHFTDCRDWDRAREDKINTSAGKDDVMNLENIAGVTDQIFERVVTDFGFDPKTAKDIKMIDAGCSGDLHGPDWHVWWGNDQRGPFQAYQDPSPGLYDQNRSAKGQGSGFNIMTFRQL